MRMEYIVMTGAIQHGKSTVTKVLADALPQAVTYETGQIISELAKPFKAGLEPADIPRLIDIDKMSEWRQKLAPLLREMVQADVAESQLAFTQHELDSNFPLYAKLFEYARNLQEHPELRDEDITPANKHLQRPLLQAIGAAGLAIDGGMWFREIIRRSRIDEEHGARYCIMNALREPAEIPSLKEVNTLILEVMRPGYDETDLRDPTESRRSLIRPDVTILNDGSVSDLENAARRFASDFSKSEKTTKGLYVATEQK